jgi:hypothetical protein
MGAKKPARADSGPMARLSATDPGGDRALSPQFELAVMIRGSFWSVFSEKVASNLIAQLDGRIVNPKEHTHYTADDHANARGLLPTTKPAKAKRESLILMTK